MYQSLRHRYDIEGVNPVSSSPPPSSFTHLSLSLSLSLSQFKVRMFFGLRSLFQAFGMAVFFMMMLVLLALPYGLSLLTTVWRERGRGREGERSHSLQFPWFFSGGMASRKGPSKESVSHSSA